MLIGLFLYYCLLDCLLRFRVRGKMIWAVCVCVGSLVVDKVHI